MEHQSKRHAYHKCKGREEEPAGRPVAYQEPVLPGAVVIDYLTCRQCSYRSSYAISHHHKQALSRSLDGGLALLVDENTSGDIEEVEGHAIDDTREDEKQHTGHGRITHTEEAETEYPGKHRHQHHHLDTITLQEKRYHEDAKGLADL